MPQRPRLAPPSPGACAAAQPVVPALATEAPHGRSRDQDRHATHSELDAVEIQGALLPTTADELARPVEVLSGERLDEAKAGTLGETVGKLPGVQSSYFGPGVGRPIVRGFDGARVQVLSDGLGSGDVSTVSADHAVSHRTLPRRPDRSAQGSGDAAVRQRRDRRRGQRRRRPHAAKR